MTRYIGTRGDFNYVEIETETVKPYIVREIRRPPGAFLLSDVRNYIEWTVLGLAGLAFAYGLGYLVAWIVRGR